MKPKAFQQSLKAGKPGSGYLFLGPEIFFRDRCRKALREAVLGQDEEGLLEIDLKEQPLTKLFDETKTLSLFAADRLIIGRNAEGALPRGRSKAATEQQQQIADYFANPTPGVVVLFECTRFDPADRDEKSKLDRVAKFFAAVPETVELERLSPSDSLRGAALLANKKELNIDNESLAELVELLGYDMARIDSELEKLALFAEKGEQVGRAQIETLVPEARQTGVFELTDALSRKDRQRSLEILDVLAKSGAYWPMQVTLLASLFRQALAVKEIGGTNSRAVATELGKHGVRVWPGRAQQLIGVARKFSVRDLEGALTALFEADRDLRRERPDDRLIMERLVVQLTA